MTIWKTKTRRGEPVRKSESLLQHRGQERSRSRSRSPSHSPRREPGEKEKPSESSVDPSLLAEVIRELAVVRAQEPSRAPADPSQDPSPNINDPHTRALTVLKLILGIAKGHNVNRRFSCDDDNDTQAFAVPRTYRPALQLLHQLTVALSPTRVFSPTQLGHSDLVAIDAFLHDDLFGHIRSIFTKEIQGHLNGLVELTAQATSYLQELAHRPQPNPDALLDRMADLFHYIHNINYRRQAISTQLTAILFTPVDELQRKLNLLATYGVTLEKIVSNNYAAAAAVAQMVKAHDTYRDILKEHLMTRNVGQGRSVVPSATAQKVVQQAIAAPPQSEAKAKPPQAEPQSTTSNPQQSSSQQSLDETAQLTSASTAHFDPEPRSFASRETFCVFISVAVIYDYLYQILFFSAVLTLGGQREPRRGNAYLCCLTVPPKSKTVKEEKPYWILRAVSKLLDFVLDSWVDFSVSVWSKVIVGGELQVDNECVLL
ncbi:unnamed protein product [Cylicocyclus nassatus]|uniref:SSD domain-containing protein n=1 Tax=Cylicocyclus nassatus TaxID=53992 RepID=A0AA36MEG3_CYLNA|nr:unnamed protein product [Cylicocyclus nassatus]